MHRCYKHISHATAKCHMQATLLHTQWETSWLNWQASPSPRTITLTDAATPSASCKNHKSICNHMHHPPKLDAPAAITHARMRMGRGRGHLFILSGSKPARQVGIHDPRVRACLPSFCNVALPCPPQAGNQDLGLSVAIHTISCICERT